MVCIHLKLLGCRVSLVVCDLKSSPGDIVLAVAIEVHLENVARWDGVRRQIKDVLGQIHGLGLGSDAVSRAIVLALAHISTLVCAVLVAVVHTIVIRRDVPILDLGIDGIAGNQKNVLHPTGALTRGIESVKLHGEPTV